MHIIVNYPDDFSNHEAMDLLEVSLLTEENPELPDDYEEI